MDQISKEDLLKLAKKLQRQNKQLTTKIEEYEAKLTAPSNTDTTSSLFGSLTSLAIPPPPPPPPNTSLTDLERKLRQAERQLRVEQENSRRDEAEILKLKETVTALQISCETLAAEKQHLIEKYELAPATAVPSDLVKSSSSRLNAKLDEMTQEIKHLEELLRASETNAALKDDQITKLQKELSLQRESLSASYAISTPITPISIVENVDESEKQILSPYEKTAALGYGRTHGRSDSITGSKLETNLRAQIEHLKMQLSESLRAIGEYKELALDAKRDAEVVQREKVVLQEQCDYAINSIRLKNRDQNAKIAALYRKLAIVEESLRVKKAELRDARSQIARLRIALAPGDESNGDASSEVVEREEEKEDESSKIMLSEEEAIDFDLVLSDMQKYLAEIELLKSEIEDLERSRNRSSENLDYLKNIVLKYLLMEKKKDERKTLVPVLGMILHFSPEEYKSVESAWR